jgi:hypothetical protein
MNTKLKPLVLLLALAAMAPAHAADIGEQVRSQGQAALESVQIEIRQSLGLPAAPAVPVRYPLEQAIRLQGRRAVRAIALEMTLDPERRTATTIAAAE